MGFIPQSENGGNNNLQIMSYYQKIKYIAEHTIGDKRQYEQFALTLLLKLQNSS